MIPGESGGSKTCGDHGTVTPGSYQPVGVSTFENPVYGTQVGELSPPKLETAEPEYESLKTPNNQEATQPYWMPDNRTYEVIDSEYVVMKPISEKKTFTEYEVMKPISEKKTDDSEYEVMKPIPEKSKYEAEQELQSFEDTFQQQAVDNPYVIKSTEDPDLGEYDDDERHITF